MEHAADGVLIIRHRVPSKRNPLFGALYPLYAARGVLRSLRGLRSAETVIHGHFPVTALPLAVTGIPYVYTFHAPVWRELLDEWQRTYQLPSPARRPAVAGVRAAERLVLRRSSRTFVLSEFVRDEANELCPGAADRVALVPGGVDIDKFRPDHRVERAGVSAPLLFTARRLTPRTGVDRLIAAMPEILRAHPAATLTIAGVGEMETQLRELVARLGVPGHVQFLGYTREASLVDWYRRATLVVMPTVALEGFGLTAAEALACGTPVVGTPVGAIPEVLGPLDSAMLSTDNRLHGARRRDHWPARGASPARVDRCPCPRIRSVVVRWRSVAARYMQAYRGDAGYASAIAGSSARR